MAAVVVTVISTVIIIHPTPTMITPTWRRRWCVPILESDETNRHQVPETRELGLHNRVEDVRLQNENDLFVRDKTRVQTPRSDKKFTAFIRWHLTWQHDIHVCTSRAKDRLRYGGRPGVKRYPCHPN
jgi:hypothetical protein